MMGSTNFQATFPRKPTSGAVVWMLSISSMIRTTTITTRAGVLNNAGTFFMKPPISVVQRRREAGVQTLFGVQPKWALRGHQRRVHGVCGGGGGGFRRVKFTPKN